MKLDSTAHPTALRNLALALLLPTTLLAQPREASPADAPPPAPIITKAAPTFQGTDARGVSFDLAEQRGKWVVLEWTNFQCPFVKNQYQTGNMGRLQEKYTEKGVVWVTLISSAPGKQGYLTGEQAREAMIANSGHPSVIVLDPSGDIGRLYEAKTTPHMFVIDPEGTLVYKGAIDSIKSTDPDDIPEATNYVAAALDAGMAGEEVETPVTRPYGCSVKY